MVLTGHPHVRGDYVAPVRLTGVPVGPSPRAWGLHPQGTPQLDDLRAIPTCVGTTHGRSPLNRQVAGHPHVRGDYEHPHALGREELGPSPRAWGLRTSTTRPTISATGHPHVRGDYT